MVVQKSSSVSKDIAAAALVMTIATANRQEESQAAATSTSKQQWGRWRQWRLHSGEGSHEAAKWRWQPWSQARSSRGARWRP